MRRVERTVPAEAARVWLQQLRAAGIGRRAAAAASGVSSVIIRRILNGQRKHILVSTQARILAVDAGCISDAARVSAAQTREFIRELIDRGYTQRQLAEWLGYRTREIHIRGERITARKASRVARLYLRIEEGRVRRDA